MPFIEYETPEGEVVEVFHRSRKDKAPKNSKRLISAASFSTGSVKEEGMSEKVKGGYHRSECEKGSRFRSNYSKKQIKTAWGW